MDILDELKNQNLPIPENIGSSAQIKSQLETQIPTSTEIANVENEFEVNPIVFENIHEDSKTALDEHLESGLEKLNEKYDLPDELKSSVSSVDDIIANIDSYSKDKNIANELLQTKVIQVVTQRHRTKSILALTKLTEAIENALLNDISNARTFDIDWYSSLEKLCYFQDRIDKMSKEYMNKTGIDESLDELKKRVQNKSDLEKVEQLSSDELRKIIGEIQNGGKSS